MITVKGPDGATLQFPDGTSQDVMRSAMSKRYGPPKAAGLTPYQQWAQSPDVDKVKPVSAPALRAGVGAIAGPPKQRSAERTAKVGAVLGAPRKDKPIQDTLMSLGMGGLQGVTGLVNQAVSEYGPVKLLTNALDTTDALAGLVQAIQSPPPKGAPRVVAPPQKPYGYFMGLPQYDPPPKVTDFADRVLEGRGEEKIFAPIEEYQAQTTPGRYAQSVGQMLPYAALGPGALPAAIGAGLGGEAGSDVAKALGGGEQAQSFGRGVGQLFGGFVRPSLKPGSTAPRLSLEAADLKAAGGSKKALAAIDRAASRANMSPEDLAAAMKNRDPSLLPYEVGGDPLVGLAEVVTQSPGPARPMALKAIDARQVEAPRVAKARVASDLGGKGDYFATQEAMATARRTAARDGMNAIGDKPISLDDNSILALRSDVARGALKRAGDNLAASTEPELRAAGANLRRLHDTVLDNPAAAQITVRDAQNISFSLKKAATAAFKSGDGDTGQTLSQLGKDIRDNARANSNEYKGWLKKYGDDVETEGALDIGRNALTNKQGVSFEQINADFASWSDAAKAAYRKGVGEALLAKIRSGKGAVGTMRDILKSEEFGDRIRLAFPDQASFDRFMEFAQRQKDIADRDYQVTGNSATFRRDAARADAEQGAPSILDVASIAHDLTSPLGITKQALKRVPKAKSAITDEKANAALGKMLFDPSGKYYGAGRELANAPRLQIGGKALPSLGVRVGDPTNGALTRFLAEPRKPALTGAPRKR